MDTVGESSDGHLSVNRGFLQVDSAPVGERRNESNTPGFSPIEPDVVATGDFSVYCC